MPDPRYWRTWERDCANYLTDQLGVEVVTSRSQSGGTQAGSDFMTKTDDGPVPHVLGWSLEAKASRNGHSPTPWCRQAAEQAEGRPWVVLAKVPHKPVGDGDAYAWVNVLGDYRRMSIRFWAELVSGKVPTRHLSVR